jgi:hypothetical protein
MNKILLTLSMLIAFADALLANDGTFVTKVIHESDPVVQLSVPIGKAMKITNFIQEGAYVTNEPGPFPGSVTVTNHPGEVKVYQGAAGLPGVTVLQSTPASTSHVAHEDVFVAGPAIVVIQPLTGVTLAFSYLRINN